MKGIPLFITSLCFVFAGSVGVTGQTCGVSPSPHGKGLGNVLPESCEPYYTPIQNHDKGTFGRDRGTLERSEAMMRKAGLSEEKIHQMRVVSQAPVFLDDAAALYGQADALKLTAEQKNKLMAIMQETRQKALDILTADQKKTLGTVPTSPITMKEICEEIHAKMKEMMKQKGGDKGLSCPMCPMMHQKDKGTQNIQTTQPAEK